MSANQYIYHDDAELIKIQFHVAEENPAKLPALIENLKSDANNGSVSAQRLLGAHYNLEGNYREAIYWFKKAALQNDGESQSWLGYLMGRERLGDPGEIIHWLCCAELNGDSKASRLLEAHRNSNPEMHEIIAYTKSKIRKNGVVYMPSSSSGNGFDNIFTAIGCLIPIIIIILFLIFV